MFTDTDIQHNSKVAVEGKTIVDNLFTNGEDPIGQIIRFNSIPFEIIGVLESKGYNTMGKDQDDVVLAPYTAVQKRILAIDYLQGIFCSAESEELTPRAVESITGILAANHNISNPDKYDFQIRSQEELSSMLTSTSDLMTILLASVAAISLLVGGIGIINIMYVSVTERTKEIGLRMSGGARVGDILWQFLIEAILISITGGESGYCWDLLHRMLWKRLPGGPS
jgi:putative ABC transport system permease protein